MKNFFLFSFIIISVITTIILAVPLIGTGVLAVYLMGEFFILNSGFIFLLYSYYYYQIYKAINSNSFFSKKVVDYSIITSILSLFFFTEYLSAKYSKSLSISISYEFYLLVFWYSIPSLVISASCVLVNFEHKFTFHIKRYYASAISSIVLLLVCSALILFPSFERKPKTVFVRESTATITEAYMEASPKTPLADDVHVVGIGSTGNGLQIVTEPNPRPKAGSPEK